MKPKIAFLVGPTASGKSEIAVILAKKLKAQIISCDSMQIYKEMDIVTSKPANNLRKKVKHHLIDVISPAKEYNVSRYRKEALKKIKEIQKKGRVPLFVGGTGLYVTILMDGIFELAPENKNIRERLYEQAQTHGSQYLYKRLQKIDPQAATKIHPHDTRRIVRALEVFESTGKPISYFQKERQGFSDKYDVRVFCINRERHGLYQRIEERVERMFKKGVVPEVKKLLKNKLSKTAFHCLGIRELKGYFDGEYDLEEAKRLLKRNTRQYAKRQLTWFRKDKRIRWINIKNKENLRDVANRIWKKLC